MIFIKISVLNKNNYLRIHEILQKKLEVLLWIFEYGLNFSKLKKILKKSRNFLENILKIVNFSLIFSRFRNLIWRPAPGTSHAATPFQAVPWDVLASPTPKKFLWALIHKHMDLRICKLISQKDAHFFLKRATVFIIWY